MESTSRKRAATAELSQPAEKRLRTTASSSLPPIVTTVETQSVPPVITPGEAARMGLKRSIALVLERIGFSTSHGSALESFTQMAESYLDSMARDVQALATSARRVQPNPVDFENTLKRFNVSVASLTPHLKPPVPRSRRLPKWKDVPPMAANDLEIPILDPELDGLEEKNSKEYIPSSFPAFPSQHTYKYTPIDVASVTVSNDWGAFEPDRPSETIASTARSLQSAAKKAVNRPLASEEIPWGDPKKLREAAAKEARLGEEALRRLMRASKIAKQKEVWSSAQRAPVRRDRHNLWEAAMREAIEEDSAGSRSKSREGLAIAGHASMGRDAIADHSMIVNSEQHRERRKLAQPGSRRPVGEAFLRH